MQPKTAFNEAKLQSLLTKWFKEHGCATMAVELKITKGNTIPFSRFEEHQINALHKVKRGKHGLSYKISDSSIGYKPFDFFTMYQEPAFFGICFYKPRKQKVIYMLDIDYFLSFYNQENKKSLTEADCQGCWEIRV